MTDLNKKGQGEREKFTAGTEKEVGGGTRAGVSRLRESSEEKGGSVAVSKRLELEQSRVQLSLWQGHSTEGFIVICNYVVFCGASVWCAPTLRLFLAREY